MERKFADLDKMVADAKRNGVQAVFVPTPTSMPGSKPRDGRR